jgi:hypothetical protein
MAAASRFGCTERKQRRACGDDDDNTNFCPYRRSRCAANAARRAVGADFVPDTAAPRRVRGQDFWAGQRRVDCQPPSGSMPAGKMCSHACCFKQHLWMGAPAHCSALFAHPLAQLTHSIAHSINHKTHLLTHPVTCSLTHTLIYSHTRSSLVRLLVHLVDRPVLCRAVLWRSSPRGRLGQQPHHNAHCSF